MKQIFLHPFAGVLSAYGMGLAEIRDLREAQIGVPFDASSVEQLLNEQGKPLRDRAISKVSDQGVPEARIDVLSKAHLRYEGTDTSLLIDVGPGERMLADFEAAHRQRFGFIADDRGLVVEAISVEAVGRSDVDVDPPSTTTDLSDESAALDSVKTYSEGEWQDASLYDRDTLQSGQRVQGPAIIIEPTATTVVDPGWCGEINSRGHLILNRYLEREKTEAIGTDVDPVMLEVFNNLFMSVAERMGATLQNTAYSVNIKERLDFSCALFNADGELIANAPHIPVHLGSMGETVKTIVAANVGTIKPGNVYALNAPYHGGTHLPDVTVVTPAFDEAGKEILFFVASRGHHADIGGRTPGSAPPDSTHIEEEGVLIDNFLLVEESRLREKALRELLGSGKYPCRNIEQNIADLSAQIAANATGVAELGKLVTSYGIDTVNAYMRHVQNNAEESVRRVIDVLTDSNFEYPLDDGSVIRIQISVDKAEREATIDFTGTSPQHPRNYNAPAAVTRAAVLYAFRCLIDDDIPLNDGCLKPIRLNIPAKSMLDPEYPAAVMAGNVEVSQAVTNALLGALGAVAASQGTMNNFLYGNDTYQNYETICGGTGAGPGFDGTSAVQSHMTNTRMTDPEVLELRFPVINEEFSIRRGSGGSGKYRGGDGAVRKLRFLEPMTATVLSSHREVAPFGLDGGNPGQCGRNFVVRANGTELSLQGNDEVNLEAGDMIVIETPGGGGYGKTQ